MKKIISIFILTVAIHHFSIGQLKMLPNGNVGIGLDNPTNRLQVSGEVFVDSYMTDWGKAFSTKVHYKSTCAYNLWSTYHNKDVFFVCGDGYLWAMRGGYFGSDSIMKKNITPIYSPLNTIKKLVVPTKQC